MRISDWSSDVCSSDLRFFIDRAAAYAKDRSVFGRAIGENQGVQFPIARAYVQIAAAALMVDKAARLFDASADCGTEANMAKMLARSEERRGGKAGVSTCSIRGSTGP